MNCEYCGNHIPPNVASCPGCGAKCKVEQQPENTAPNSAMSNFGSVDVYIKIKVILLMPLKRSVQSPVGIWQEQNVLLRVILLLLHSVFPKQKQRHCKADFPQPALTRQYSLPIQPGKRCRHRIQILQHNLHLRKKVV